MNTLSRQRRALALFDELVDLPPAERAQRLSTLRDDEPALHDAVAALLAADADPASALDRSPASLFADEAIAADESAPPPGELIGPWRIVGVIGRGGMGAVYRGERADGAFRQQAAIKLIRLGLDHPDLRRRFLRERQILASLKHPNIATLLDGGVAGNGAPYFAMELIDGQPITRWCDAQRHDLHARIRLFLQVCAAVQHAHQNLTVHRDLKPSNILVTQDGQAKLLDFGIAKLLQDDGDGGATSDRAFTPDYAAPEQIRGEAITTATDLYALGVVLFELLAGTRPFDTGGQGHAKPSPASPERAPASLSRAAERIAPEQAQARGFSPKTLAAALRGDLSAIVQRCLQPEPERRYASAEALGNDLTAWLDGRPVAAARGDGLYRLRKFAARHRWGVAASLVAMLAIAAALGAAVWQARNARAQAALAQSEAAKATAVKDFLVGIFERNSLLHADGADARKATAEELLEIGAERIRGSLHEAPETRAELLGTMGDLYAQLSLQDTAMSLYREQLADLRAIHRPPHPLIAEALQKLAYSQVEHGDYAGAERTVREALRMFEALGDTHSLSHALALATLSHVIYRTRAQAPEGLQAATRALRIVETHHRGSPAHVDMLLEMGRVVDIQQGIRAAEPYVRQALELAQKPPLNGNKFMLALCYQNMGDTERLLGRYAEAEATLRKALQTYVVAAGIEHPYASDAHRELARLLNTVGKREEALATIRAGLGRLERSTGPDNPNLTSYSRLEYGTILLARGELDAAAQEIDRAVAAWREAKTGVLGRGLAVQGRLQIAQGRYAQAAPTLAEAEPTVAAVWGENSALRADVLVQQGRLRLARDDAEGASALFRRVLKEWPRKPDETPMHLVQAQLGLARASLLAGDRASAQSTAQATLRQIETDPYRLGLPDQEAEARMLLGLAMLRSGHAAQARPHLEAAVAQRLRLDAPRSPVLAEARLALAEDLLALGLTAEAEALRRSAATVRAPHAARQDGYLRAQQATAMARR